MYAGLVSGLFLLRYAARAKSGDLLYWSVLAGLFLFSAFRFHVGCDWGGYYYNYILGASLAYDEALGYREPLWWVIQVALNRLGLPYPAVNVVTSAIFFAGIHAIARRQPDRLGFLVLLVPILIINMPMSGIRQAAAIGFMCFSLTAFLDRRPVGFVCWILLAGAIHSSALVFLLLTPLATGRLTPLRVVAAVLLAVPGLLLIGQSDDAEVAISRYVGSGVDAFGAAFRVGIVALSGIYFFVFLRQAWAEEFPEEYDLASCGAWLMIVSLALLPLSTVIADRFAYYLLPMQALIFARIPFLSVPRANLLAVMPYVGLLLVFVVWSHQSSLFEACYVPYRTWLFGFPEYATYVW